MSTTGSMLLLCDNLAPGGATAGAGALGVAGRVKGLVSPSPHEPSGPTSIASACPGKSSKQSNGKLVTKEAKIMMIRIFYPCTAPTWRDEHLVRVGEDSVWSFKPIQWVDDVSNMWLGGQLRVRLTAEEMLLLEQLPWFILLIEKKRAKRKYRYIRTGVEPYTSKYRKTNHYDEPRT